ncbi:MAG TPA: EamA family transporter [Anaerolineales bacterium]|nr:EamA family transporter [Anaerolineales bacterium]
MKSNNLALLGLLALLWGPSFLFIKIAVEQIPPLTLVAIRLGLAAVFLYLVLKISGRSLPRGWSEWKKFVVMGFFANALPFVLFSFGEQFADSGAASILNGTTPIFTVLLAHYFIEDERLTANRFIGVMIGFLGILLIFAPDLARLVNGQALESTAAVIGLLAFIVASICYGFAIVYGRKRLRGLPPLVGPAAQLICAAAMVLPLSLLVDRPFTLTPGLPALLSAGALGLFGTAFAYLVYYRLVDQAGATFISLVTYLLPPIGVVLGILVLAEQPGVYALVGMGVIIGGVMIVNRVERKKPA